jgi:carboxylesterase type B
MHAFGTKLFNIKSYVNKKPHSTLVGLFAYRVPFVAATHCYELRYLFGKGMFAKFRPDETDLKVLDLMSTMWTNYAKTG